MMIFVVGKPDSGKSAFAEDLAVELAGEDKKLYLATMIPYGDAGEARIRKHREMRKDKGFDTIEKPSGLKALSEEIQPYGNGVCLLECVANLAGNEMHDPLNKDLSIEQLSELVAEEILWLKERVRELIVVSDVFEITAGCDKETADYIELVNMINRICKDKADRVNEL